MDDPAPDRITAPGPVDVGLASLGLSGVPGDWPEDIEAEVRLEHGQVQVTLALAGVARDDLRYFVGSNILLVWSDVDAQNVRSMVRLPVDVAQDTAVIRFINGVFDLTVLATGGAPAASQHDGIEGSS